MRLTWTRSGGVAGWQRTTTVDEARLLPEEAARLRELVEQAGFFQLPAHLVTSQPQPDRFQYELTVEDDTRRHTIHVDEQSLPATLRPLLDWLDRHR